MQSLIHNQTSQDAFIHTFIYPAGISSTLSLRGQFATESLTDERDDSDANRPIGLITEVQTNDPDGDFDGANVELSDGTSGFWGMGVYQADKSRSMFGDMITVNGSGSSSQETSFAVGFDINNYSTSTAEQAGIIHWGGVPNGSWTGNFNWLDANTSVAGSWGFGLDSMRVSDEVINLDSYYGSIDPGFDEIYVPTSVAEKFFAKISGAQRDTIDTTRRNLPCGTNISMTLIISGAAYAVASSQLVQARDVAGRTCWGSVVAWQNNSLAEQKGEIRLGTPFMSNIYSVLYYSDSAQYVGLAGKPNSVNAHNLAARSEGHTNTKLAGILIGTLLGVVLLLFAICYSRNRSSFQSIYYRAVRRQHRAQMNVMVRSAILPPHQMMAMPIANPAIMGPMRPMPMGGPGNPMTSGMTGLTFAGGGYQPVAPPAYQHPINAGQPAASYDQTQLLLANHDHNNNDQHQFEKMPVVVEQKPQGFYSPRLQETSPPRSSFLPFIPRLSAISHQGLRPQSSSAGYARPSQSGEPKVRFGSTGVRIARSASSMSAGKSVNEFGILDGSGRDLQSGVKGREARREKFMQDYASAGNLGVQQTSHYTPFPGASNVSNPPSRYYSPSQTHVQMYPTVALQANGDYAHSQTSEKKRYFSWKPGGDAGKGLYKPVLGGMSEASEEQTARKSWFGARSGGWKEAERARDRERLAQGGRECVN
ncbi:hypothetical protein CNBM1980 [Cryptococcus deneoformans B-3501A]|uniref:hypothetical protein n=1 Tax=Cryptococcus deneoformans (strain B-3501A) TaxID=283643 RepID=UPI000042E829|nr:hypothetical protein CNBM1980 [Cryptococcus neoformans var. neoformans B-3501A]EAL17393.1 hypothetical protein CNBM1980 [Cryptococcus neoformans var. neoformans B-3501A]